MVIGVNDIFNSPPVYFTVVVSNPTKLNDSISLLLALMVKLPFLLLLAKAFVVMFFIVTPSKVIPLLSVTNPFILCFCAKAGMQNKVKIKEHKMSLFFIIGGRF